MFMVFVSCYVTWIWYIYQRGELEKRERGRERRGEKEERKRGKERGNSACV
jgi:hypothetical protein